MNEFICLESIRHLKAQLLAVVDGSKSKRNPARETTIRELLKSEPDRLRDILDGKE